MELGFYTFMLVIRLQRAGKRNQPIFKIVLAEKTSPVKGRFIEKLGFLNTLKKEKNINAERIKHWISKGAQPSDTVYNILVDEKIIEGPKRFVKIKKKKEKKKGKEETEKEEGGGEKPKKEAEEPPEDKSSEKKKTKEETKEKTEEKKED